MTNRLLFILCSLLISGLAACSTNSESDDGATPDPTADATTEDGSTATDASEADDTTSTEDVATPEDSAATEDTPADDASTTEDTTLDEDASTEDGGEMQDAVEADGDSDLTDDVPEDIDFEIVEDCVGLSADELAAATPYTDVPEDPSALGSPPPAFELQDLQPLSCGYGQTYGVSPYRGQVTLVTLLSAGCSFCQAQIAKLEEMQIELTLSGYDVAMLTVNLDSQADRIDRLTERSSMPIWQDTEEIDVWGLYNGRKDDIYIYNADHELTAFFRSGQDPSLNLSQEEGYANVRAAIIAAFGE